MLREGGDDFLITGFGFWIFLKLQVALGSDVFYVWQQLVLGIGGDKSGGIFQPFVVLLDFQIAEGRVVVSLRRDFDLGMASGDLGLRWKGLRRLLGILVKSVRLVELEVQEVGVVSLGCHKLARHVGSFGKLLALDLNAAEPVPR